MSRRPSIFEDHLGFEPSAMLQEKIQLIPLPNVPPIHRKSFLKISPIKVSLLKNPSPLLEFSHKGENFQVFPLKSFQYNLKMPLKFINGLYKGQILAQGMIKIDKNFFLMSIYFGIKGESFEDSRIIHLSNPIEAEEITKKKIKQWEILIKIDKLKESLDYREEIHISFEQFLHTFMPNNAFSYEKILKFLFNRKFSSFDEKILLKTSLKLFTIEKCRIVLKETKEVCKIKENSLSHVNAKPYLPYSLKYLTHEEFLLASKPNKIDHSYIVTFGDSIKTLNHYNTIRFLSKMTYYMRIKVRHTMKFIRVNFINPENSSTYIKISYYEPMKAIREYCFVHHEQDLEKIINVLQLMCEKQKTKIFNMYLNIVNDLVGRKLYFFKDWPQRKNYSSANNQSRITKLNNQALKMIIISKNDDPFIKTYYDLKTYFEMFKLDILGKCYVKISYYKPNEKLMLNQAMDNKIFFKFEFFPYTSKTKVYKFMISLYDIKEFLQINLKFDNERIMMNSLNRCILKKLKLCKSNLYHNLMIPDQEISHSQMSSKRFLNYKMKFRKLVYEHKEIITFLNKEYSSYYPIFHMVKRIQNEFCIITIQKHNFLQHWVLKIYVVKSNRELLCYICNEDIIRMNLNFLEDLYPFEMSCINKIFKRASNNLKYDKFSDDYQKLRTEHADNLINHNHPQEYSNKKCHPFIEMKFWEDLLNNMILSLNMNGKMTLTINNFKGIIREYLFHDIIERNNNQDYLIFLEVFFENKKFKSPNDIFNKLPNISYHNANHYNIYIRLTNLQYFGVSNEKFTLRDLIYSYSLEAINHLDSEKLNKMVFFQAELKNLCNFLKFKLQNRDLQRNVLEFNDKRVKFNKEIVIKNDATGKAFKRLNCNINLQNILFNKEKKFVLIYKSVFTIKPLKIVSVSFTPHKLLFYIDIYNLRNCQNFSKKISLFYVKNYLPFIKEMLSWNLFYLIGERLIKILKNTLIVESFIKTK